VAQIILELIKLHESPESEHLYIYKTYKSILRYMVMCMQNDTASLENSWAVSYKTKYTITMQFIKHTPGIHPPLEMKTNPHKNMHMNIHNSFILIAKNWKQPKCPSIGE